LTRVEAVGDIIHSTSDLGLKVSAGQLRGRLYGAIRDMTDRVAHVAALVTAAIDFPEEEVVEAHRTDFLARLTTVKQDLSSLAATAQKGRILTEGLAVAIVGRPNVGKSSLLNTLLRENRAIVTETAGTTRDTLEEVVQMGGMALRLIDTAGIRETGDQVEQLGISRSIQAMERADLVLWMVDGAEGITDEDLRLAATVPPDKTMVVVNKLDRMMGGALNLPPPLDLTPLAPLAQVVLSAKEGLGIHRLEQAIQDWAVGDTRPLLEHPLVTNTRQKQAAETALAALEEAVAGVQAGRGEELLALDLNRVLESLGEIVGETTPDDLLNRVFEQFCIGK
ncbi:MAG: 50S ribosome-binding GTPase, partial [Deltaproteobacteria bacterium]|nr:50S ribosome-binding GTPase [Deltaproteobacteria bacterium]